MHAKDNVGSPEQCNGITAYNINEFKSFIWSENKAKWGQLSYTVCFTEINTLDNIFRDNLDSLKDLKVALWEKEHFQYLQLPNVTKLFSRMQ